MTDAASPSKRAADDQVTPVDPKKVKVDEVDTAEAEAANEEDDDKLDEDDLAEIDQSNIIETGRRTRGKQYDFAKLNAEYDGPEGEEDDGEAPVAAEGEDEDEDEATEMEGDESKEADESKDE